MTTLRKLQNQYCVLTNHEKDENDNIYFNIEIRPTNETFGDPARYQAQRTIPLINDASKYYCSIIRFNLPNYFVPIHIMPIQENQADPNLSQYSVTLEYNGDVQQVFLDYVSTGDFPTPLPPSSNPNGKQSNSAYYWIFEYCSMTNMINTALETAFNNLATKPATIGANPPSAPIIVFNENNNIFSYVAQSDYYDTVNPSDPNGAIKVYMNGKLFTILNGFCIKQVNVSVGGASKIENFSPDGRDTQLIFRDYYNNNNLSQFQPPFGGDYYNLTQQYSSIYDWNPFKRIVFVSNSLPINGENIQGSGSSTLKVITDFQPYVTEQVRSVWQYFPEGQYRLVDMTSHEKIDTIDLQIYWIDNFDNFYQIQIPWNQEATIKLAFLNKKLYKTFIDSEKVNKIR